MNNMAANSFSCLPYATR
jgi:hypothetical protein